MEETPVTKSVVMEEKAPKDFKKHESLEDIDEVELPPEKIGWPFTLVLLYFHCGSLYFLKLLLEGRVGWATVVTGEVEQELTYRARNPIILTDQPFTNAPFQASFSATRVVLELQLELIDFGRTGVSRPRRP